MQKVAQDQSSFWQNISKAEDLPDFTANEIQNGTLNLDHGNGEVKDFLKQPGSHSFILATLEDQASLPFNTYLSPTHRHEKITAHSVGTGYLQDNTPETRQHSETKEKPLNARQIECPRSSEAYINRSLLATYEERLSLQGVSKKGRKSTDHLPKHILEDNSEKCVQDLACSLI
jgi:hypothetical protein